MVHHVGGGGAGSHGHEADEVFRFAEIPVEGHAHAVVEESEIKSDVPCGGLLPLEVGIVGTGIEGVGDDVAVGVDILACGEVGIVAALGRAYIYRYVGEVAAYTLLTGDTPAEAQLTNPPLQIVHV